MKYRGDHRNKLKTLCVTAMLCAGLLIADSGFAAKLKVPKNKLGATHHTHNTGAYTLEEQSSTNSGTASGALVGFALFYERLFGDRFGAGLKYGYGLERSLEMEGLGSNDVKILEQASFFSLEFKAYMKDNIRPGLKPFLGVSYGQYTTTSTLSVISSGTATEDETTATIPFTVLSAGSDYTFGFGGIRLEFGISTGERDDLESSDTYFANYDYSGSILGISVYSFF